MTTFIAGLVILASVMSYVLEGSTDTYVNMHALVLVIFGSIGILIISNPPRVIWDVMLSLVRMLTRDNSVHRYQKILVELSRNPGRKVESRHPLLVYAQELWEQGVDRDLFSTFMVQRTREVNRVTEQAAVAVRNLAKYPPALGMTGTVIGMVSLFSKLNPDSRGQIGLGLALAMTATFYGLVLANLVIMPLADRLHVFHLRSIKANEQILHVLLLIDERQPPKLVEEEIHGAAA